MAQAAPTHRYRATAAFIRGSHRNNRLYFGEKEVPIIMVFTLTGQQYQLSKEEVEEVMGGVPPFRGNYWFVVINGEKYPPNQVLYYSLRKQCEGLSLADFRNDAAKNILEQMGFQLITEGGNA
jgi:hypothetical protein